MTDPAAPRTDLGWRSLPPAARIYAAGVIVSGTWVLLRVFPHDYPRPFLFATLLWHEVLVTWNAAKQRGERPLPALFDAMDKVLDAQASRIAIPRRFEATIGCGIDDLLPLEIGNLALEDHIWTGEAPNLWRHFAPGDANPEPRAGLPNSRNDLAHEPSQTVSIWRGRTSQPSGDIARITALGETARRKGYVPPGWKDGMKRAMTLNAR